MVRKERSFFGKVIVFLLATMAVVGLIAMALSVLSPYIRPASFVWPAYFGLAFWAIFAFNSVIFVLLLLMWSRKAWIAVLALVISIPGMMKSYSFGSKTEQEKSLKVMSYNVHFFSHLDGEVTGEEFVNQVINLVREESPDVFCCQEFRQYLPKNNYKKCIEEFSRSIGYPYISYNRNNTPEGNVIFSKYPLSDVSAESVFVKKGFGALTTVDAGERGVFYLANVHLTSYNISDSELKVLGKPAEQHDLLDTVGMTVVRKLKLGFQKRNEQVDYMMQDLSALEGPVIVCGDFNETPVSHVYHRMKKAGFYDSFIDAGRGVKPTYAGSLPWLRIDYVWVNDKVIPLSFERIRHKGSDHYPVVMEFTVDRSAAKPEMKPVDNTVNSKENQLINTELI